MVAPVFSVSNRGWVLVRQDYLQRNHVAHAES